MNDYPKIYRWVTIRDKLLDPEEIDPNSIINVIEWSNHFSGVNRLPNDVGLPLERCVIGSYQAAYLEEYLEITDDESRKSYLEEGIASVLIHIIASYEMTGRESIKLLPRAKCWNDIRISLRFKDIQNIIQCIFGSILKYQRWMLYNHMKRTKRWDEKEFRRSFMWIVDYCMQFSKKCDCDLARGFSLAISKIQDSEINRH